MLRIRILTCLLRVSYPHGPGRASPGNVRSGMSCSRLPWIRQLSHLDPSALSSGRAVHLGRSLEFDMYRSFADLTLIRIFTDWGGFRSDFSDIQKKLLGLSNSRNIRRQCCGFGIRDGKKSGSGNRDIHPGSWICGSVPLTKGSGFGFGSGSCSFLQ